MVTEQSKTLGVLQTAIQMEIDGKGYYLKISQESSNKMGKELLQALAAAEDLHRLKFTEIYNAIRNKKSWPVVTLPPDRGKRLKTVFATATAELDTKPETLNSELDALQKAMDMENKTYDFYRNQEGKASHDVERTFYQSLAAEERQHHQVLLDYFEYLKNPAGWFVNKERHSLDGG
ncbi:MAG: ferritin family protein [Chloroflexi bacterium]|nr:ferritin family protein [Chloroflexota bacterium]